MNRRNLLKRTGQTAAGVGATGATAGTAAAADTWCGAYCTTRPYYTCEPEEEGSVDGFVYRNVPGFDKDWDDSCGRGKVIQVHVPGWQTSRTEGFDKARKTAHYLEAADFAHETMLWDWKSDCGNCSWSNFWDCQHQFHVAEDIAWLDGHRLANFFRLFHDHAGGNTLYVTTHSLGARVFLSALWHLQAYYGDNRTLVRSAHLMGAAVEHDWPDWTRMRRGINRNTTMTWNYHNPNDDVLEVFFYGDGGTRALGEVGNDGAPCAFYDRVCYDGDSHGYHNYISHCYNRTVRDMAIAPEARESLCG